MQRNNGVLVEWRSRAWFCMHYHLGREGVCAEAALKIGLWLPENQRLS